MHTLVSAACAIIAVAAFALSYLLFATIVQPDSTQLCGASRINRWQLAALKPIYSTKHISTTKQLGVIHIDVPLMTTDLLSR
jgi:hypothetical protein